MSRVGKKWTNEEDEILKEEVLNKLNYEEIAENHKRNIGGIKSRVISNIIDPYLKKTNKPVNIKELKDEFGIEEHLLSKYLNIPQDNLILNEIRILSNKIDELTLKLEEKEKTQTLVYYIF